MKRAGFGSIAVMLALLALWVQAAPGSETAVIAVHYRDAEELLPTVRNLLSSQGWVTADSRTNSLVVSDTAERMEAVRAFLAASDQPGRTARIRFRFLETRHERRRSADARGTVSGDRWRISTPGAAGKGVTVTLGDRDRKHSQSGEVFVTVNSGGTAYIAVGQDIPYSRRWVFLSRRYAAVTEITVFQSVETGMEVTPVVSGSVATVSILPRIGYVEPSGRSGTVRFARAATELTVPLNQWVPIAGTTVESREVLDAILESGTGSGGSGVSMELMVESP